MAGVPIQFSNEHTRKAQAAGQLYENAKAATANQEDCIQMVEL